MLYDGDGRKTPKYTKDKTFSEKNVRWVILGESKIFVIVGRGRVVTCLCVLTLSCFLDVSSLDNCC